MLQIPADRVFCWGGDDTAVQLHDCAAWHAVGLQVSEDEEDAKRLIRDIRGLKKRCQLLEAETDALCATNTELQTAVSDRDQRLHQQQQVIDNLEATINDQSSDIRTALQLVCPLPLTLPPYLCIPISASFTPSTGLVVRNGKHRHKVPCCIA